jgi:ethanolamine utilization protein EutN
MQVGRVVGTLVATRKDNSLVGLKLLIVQPLNLRLQAEGGPRVMVDTVGAGVGEVVLFSSGTAARNAVKNKEAAMDAAIVGIVDHFEVDGQWLPEPETLNPLQDRAPSTEGEETLE